MTATLLDIKGYVARAQKEGAAYLIVACDTYDYENYPVFVKTDDEFWAEYRRIAGGSMQKVDEVYDLSLDILKQIRERRAFRPPARPATPILPVEDLIQHTFTPGARGVCIVPVPIDGQTHYAPCGKMLVLHTGVDAS